MQELFSLVGKLSVEGVQKAEQDINQVTDTAEKSSSRFSGFLSGLGSLAVNVGKAVATGLAVAGGAIATLTKLSIDAYAEYEQLVGGIETLFGTGGQSIEEYAKSVGKSVADVTQEYNNLMKAQDMAMKNAEDAWKNQGMSANEYMTNITNFSASLIQSLEGDTVKAVEVADLALTDMADNANKMGTDMERITDAYQGFSRQNFMMLDNLKLGYGGTKEEMQRLLEDAENIKKANGEMVEYSIDSFADMIEAIHVVQEEMGITGTTALEASTTIEGSMKQAKSAWQNFLVGLADDEQDLSVLMTNLASSIGTVADNVIPRVQQVFKALPDAISTLLPSIVKIIGAMLPSLLQSAMALIKNLVKEIPNLLGQLVDAIVDFAPTLVDTGGELINELVNGFVDGLPQLIEQGGEFLSNLGEGIQKGMPDFVSNALDLIDQFVNSLVDNLPNLIDVGGEFILNIVQGIMDSLPTLIEKAPEIISNLARAISDAVQQLLGIGLEIIVTIGEGILNAIPTLIANFGEVVTAIFDVWNAINWLNLGKNLVTGIWNGIKNMWSSFTGWVKSGFESIGTNIGNIFNGIKTFATNIWNGIATAIKTPIDAVKNTLSTIINTIKTNVTNVFNGVKTTVTNIWNGIKDAIMKPIETAKNFIGDCIDAIKGFFNFKFEWPHIPLPHFNISGSANPLDWFSQGLPKISVDWYAKGGILENPTAFGINPNTGNLMVGGEAGPEAIAPIDELQKYVQDAVNAGDTSTILNSILQLLRDMLPSMNMQIVLDTGVLVGEVAPQFDKELGRIRERNNRR